MKKLAPPVVVRVVTIAPSSVPAAEFEATTVCVPAPPRIVRYFLPFAEIVSGFAPPLVIVAEVEPFVKFILNAVLLLDPPACPRGAALSSFKNTEACPSTKP